jgi:hypothetical protein
MSIDEKAKLLHDFFGVVEFPQKTFELAVYFASALLHKAGRR